MIILDNSNEVLQLKIKNNVTTTPLEWTVNYITLDTSGGSYTPTNNDGNITFSSLNADLVQGTSNYQQIKYLTVYNRDTVSNVVTILKYLTLSSTERILCSVKLNPDATLQYSDQDGFSIIESSNGVLYSTNPIAVSAGTASLTNSNAILSNSNNISFSMNNNTVVGSYNYNTLTQSFFQNFAEYQPNGASGSSGAVAMSFQRVIIPYNISANRLDLLAHLTVVGSTAGSWSILAGLYTRSNLTIYRVYSTSGTMTWNSGGATSDTNSYSGVSGTRIRSMNFQYNFTPGEYWLGFLNSIAGPAGTTGSVTIYGQSAVSLTMEPGLRTLMVGNGIGIYGLYTYATVSFPDSIFLNVEMVFQGQSNAMRQPTFALYN